MINQHQLRTLVVKPTLQLMDGNIPYSDHAVELLMMTQAHESLGGEFLKQIGGPALGIYQMEQNTEQDVWDNYLKYNPEVRAIIEDTLPLFGKDPSGMDLIRNLEYATAIARVQYFRDRAPIPDGDLSDDKTIWALAEYAKRVWNTQLGKATARDYYEKYMKYCLPR